MAKLTPMMEQYFQIKNKYKDCILFYRLGDFYEMFYDDALTASRELEITLTGKNCGQEEKAPMCGVPFHSCEPYINKLVEKGFRVAICEQVEDPKAAKGIVKRDVIRVVTPGTNVMTQSLDESKNNFIMSVFCEDDLFGIGVCDLSTGEFRTTQVEHQDALFDEMNKFQPSEIICNDAFCICGMDFDYIRDKVGAVISPVSSDYFETDRCEKLIKEQYALVNLEGIGLSDYPFGMIASGALLQYLHETQKNSLAHLMELKVYSTENYMVIDSSTRRNLELCETLREKGKKGSLLWVLDKTKTAMGARTLRKMIEQPLIHKGAIQDRLDAVEMLKDNLMAREELREYMNSIYDLERLTMKVSYRTANPRDLISFKTSIQYLPYIKDILAQFSKGVLAKMAESLDTLEDLHELLESSIEEDPPIPIKEGGIIKEGFDEEIDHLKKAKTDGKTWLAELEEREREKTGIKNLRVRFNKVFGYYIEVTNSYKDLVPDYYIRRQTLANAERYTTEELSELARTILGAEDKLYALEYETYVAIREKLASEMERIQKTACVIAWTDVFASLALVAEANQYVRPTLNQRGVIDIKDGRHPVVEKMMSGELLQIDQDQLRLVSLDGQRISIRKISLKESYDPIKAVIPGKTLNEISKILSGDMDDDVRIYFTDRHVLFEFDQTVVVSRLLEGEYFQIDKMISSDYNTKITINKKELQGCIERASLLIRESERKPIIINVTDGSMEMKIQSAMGSMNEDIDISKEGRDIMIGFNPKFILDALRVIDDEEITMYLVNPKAPFIIKNDEQSYIYLVLPISFNM